MRLFAFILRHYHWFPGQMTSQKQMQKTHTDDVSLPRSRSASDDWSYHMGNLLQPVRSTTQIWVVTRHQYGTFALFSQTSFIGETSGGVMKCCLFNQAKYLLVYKCNAGKSIEVVHMHSLAFAFAFWIVVVYQPLMWVAWQNKSIYNLNGTETKTIWKTRWP